ncbi:MAG TPA: PKD domain-containing protein, partial [Candidatus Thermoplasmatota archaeon]|nr:PKD domain-containing protein [Candidatus Thermoplasmatota archaeon]
FWVGPWTLTSGWGALDTVLRSSKASGTTPVVYWYYWGDSISPDCVENGCDGRTRAQWTSMTATLAQHVKDQMGGAEVLIVLENEFNKQGITGAYAPTFDGYLEGVAKTLKAVPGVKLVLGFGAWGESAWTQFPKSAAQCEYIGFQMMRGSTRHTEAQYRDAAGQVAYFTSFIAQKFNKPSFLYDLALSSYPDARWEVIQAETLQGVFDNLVTAGQTGLQGVIYRSLRDHWMDPINYFGDAESHWGLQYSDGRAKPAWHVWKTAAAGGPAGPNVPGAFEAEAIPATTGGRQAESSASGGAAWNLWTNGELRAPLQADAAFDARITVVARGDVAAGVPPRMEVRLGQTLLQGFDVPPGYAPYVVDARIPAGGSTLVVAFMNDALVNGQDRNLVVDVVRVAAAPVNRAPTAAFALSGANLSWSVDASGSADPDGDALTYAWSFGDGATAAGREARHDYAAAGTYTVALTVSDGKASATATRSVTAVRPNAAPTAAFLVEGADLTWRFDASPSSDPDGDALAYAWDFGDGATATGPTATRAYAAPGAYEVRLTVSDGRESATAARAVQATQPNRAPVAAFAVSGANLTWTFDARATTDADGDALTYAWDFGDGTTGAGATPSHAYAAEGSYVVRLVASDGRLSSSASQAVTAVRPNRAPVATFGVSGSGLAWTFDAASSTDPDGDRLTYAWSFGDGATATGARVTHEYAPGSYTARLTVTDDRGASATAAQGVTAQPILSRVVEAESFTRKDNGAAFNDATASGGKAWLLWSNGGMSSAFASGYGKFVVEVVAKGDYASAWPTMELRADGALVATFTVDSATWKTFRAEVPFHGASRTLSVHFTNDAIVSGKDRNLRVDVVRVVPAPVAVEAETAARRDTGKAFSDAAASGGKGWTLWTNGAVAQDLVLPAGKWRITVVAAGEEAAGWPTMDVRVDGATIGTATVSSRALASYAFDATIATDGTHTVSAWFTNDFRAPGMDRNLRVDVIRLAPA